jgi:hypothetical protein
MSSNLKEALAIQRRYYSETASKYEQMHAHEGDDNAFNRKFVEAMLQILGAQSALDVGTATGYRLHDLRTALPNAFLCGIEPVDALLGIARRNDVLSSGARSGAPVRRQEFRRRLRICNEKTQSWFHPLMTSSGVLACAIKENC